MKKFRLNEVFGSKFTVFYPDQHTPDEGRYTTSETIVATKPRAIIHM